MSAANSKLDDAGQVAEARARRALRRVALALPHLADLVARARVRVSQRVSTAAVTKGGQLILGPRWVASLDDRALMFVVAHELLHLRLHTQERAAGADLLAFNVAHDAVINDILADALKMPVPAGGVCVPGARHSSAEALLRIVVEQGLTERAHWDRVECRAEDAEYESDLAEREAEDDAQDGDEHEDDIDEDVEGSVRVRVCPGWVEQTFVFRDVKLSRDLERIFPVRLRWHRVRSRVRARAAELPRADLALQPGTDAVFPEGRSFSRASRRANDRQDLVVPGRSRASETVHVLLDTSTSMVNHLPRCLGALQSLCEAYGVPALRLMQAGRKVRSDTWVEAGALCELDLEGPADREIFVLGKSACRSALAPRTDLRPALAQLEADPSVRVALVLTDGDVRIPERAPGFDVVWGLPSRNDDFMPSYGARLSMVP